MAVRPLQRALYKAYSAAASTVMPVPPTRPDCIQLTATVTAVRDLSPAFRRVTLHARELASLELTGPDEYVGLFMPPPGQGLVLPEVSLDPRAAVKSLDPGIRPGLRWYTIRAHRCADAEIDIDIVSSGHDGPGATWAREVTAGDEVGVWVATALYACAPEHGRHLLLADETGLPGVLAILDAARTRQEAPECVAIVEVPGEDYLHDEVRTVDLRVVLRGDGEPGSALLPALEQVEGPIDFAWVCAEARTIAQARRHLVKERHVPRRSVLASGFWRVGRERP